MKLSKDIQENMKSAFAENKVLAHILSTIVEGGKILARGAQVELLLGMLPGVLTYEVMEDIEGARGLSSVDLVLVENLSVDELWKLAHLSPAKVIHYSDSEFDPSLYETTANEKTLRSAILSLGLIHKNFGESFPHQDLFHGAKLGALLLDRDGVLLRYEEYLKEPEKVEILAEMVDLLARAHEAGLKVGVITNQSGIGRGWISWEQYHQVTLRMNTLLAQQGQWLDFIIEGPYHETAESISGMVRASLRKPRPGMILEARDRHGLDLSKSVFIGDRASDLMAAALAGVGRAFLFKSDHMASELEKWRNWPLVSRSTWGLQVPVLERPSDLVFSKS